LGRLGHALGRLGHALYFGLCLRTHLPSAFGFGQRSIVLAHYPQLLKSKGEKMDIITIKNPFFWALLSMLALLGACSVVGSKKIGSRPALGWFIVTIFFAGRFILALPSIPQPQFDLYGLNLIIGIPLFIAGIIFALGPCFLIRPLNIAENHMELITKGFYKYTRNPIYLGEIFWCFGWSIIHGSIIGVILVPFWWTGLLFLVAIEEESLERALGQKYLKYKEKVKGRIIPGLPI
jgi:protein-S-isoprenylcysteine O-methyltransferase Ste14